MKVTNELHQSLAPRAPALPRAYWSPYNAEEDTQDTVVINEGAADVDFRVESSSNTHMIFSEGSTNRVGIGNATLVLMWLIMKEMELMVEVLPIR